MRDSVLHACPFEYRLSHSRDHLQIILTQDLVRHVVIFPAQHDHRLTVTLDCAPLPCEAGLGWLEEDRARSDGEQADLESGAEELGDATIVATDRASLKRFRSESVSPSPRPAATRKYPATLSPHKDDSSCTEPESDTDLMHFIMEDYASRNEAVPTDELEKFADSVIKDPALIELLCKFYAEQGEPVPKPLLHAALACDPIY